MTYEKYVKAVSLGKTMDEIMIKTIIDHNKELQAKYDKLLTFVTKVSKLDTDECILIANDADQLLRELEE